MTPPPQIYPTSATGAVHHRHRRVPVATWLLSVVAGCLLIPASASIGYAADHQKSVVQVHRLPTPVDDELQRKVKAYIEWLKLHPEPDPMVCNEG